MERANLWYRVAAENQSLDVRVRLFAPPERTTFFLPGEWAGRSDYDDAIRIAGARSADGPLEITISRDRGEVEVTSQDAEWVELHYRVELEARSDFHPQLDRGILVAFGPTFLVTPAQQILERTRSIPLEIVLPDDWSVVSTWPLHGSKPSAATPGHTVHGYVAADTNALRDAFLVAGSTLRTERRGDDGTLVEVAYGPAVEVDVVRFSDWVDSLIGEYRRTYGPAGPVHVYVRSRTATSEELRGLGRRGGFVVDIPPDAQLSGNTKLLVAHEALHLWNGHLLLPKPEAEPATRWFKEGVTHYLALKMLARSGGIDEEFVLGELATAAGNYSRNPVTAGAKGRHSDRRRHPYDFGLLVALGFDATVTKSNGGRVGVEQWLIELLEAPEKRYDAGSLFAALQRTIQGAGEANGNRALANSWRRRVRGREPIDPRELFEEVGLHWLAARGDRPARLSPLDRAEPLYRTLFGFEGNDP